MPLETGDITTLTEAVPGDNVRFNIKKVSVKVIKRGYVTSGSKNKPSAGNNIFDYIGVIDDPSRLCTSLID